MRKATFFVLLWVIFAVFSWFVVVSTITQHTIVAEKDSEATPAPLNQSSVLDTQVDFSHVMMTAPRAAMFLYPGLTLQELLTAYDGAAICEFLLAGLVPMPPFADPSKDSCRGIDDGTESMIACIDRIGGRVLDRGLHSRCRTTKWWQEFAVHRGPAYIAGKSPEIRDRVTVSQMQWVVPPPYVPPAERTYPKLQPPVMTNDNNSVYSLSYAVPREIVVEQVDEHKYWDFPPFVPENSKTAHWAGKLDEPFYNLVLQKSRYAYTSRRGDWDCYRHYEILAQGTIPYFPDLELCNTKCLPFLPKDELRAIYKWPSLQHINHGHRLDGKPVPNVVRDWIHAPSRVRHAINGSEAAGNEEKMETQLAGRFFLPARVRGHGRKHIFAKTGHIDRGLHNESQYIQAARSLLQYTQEKLTCRAMAAYMLKVLEYEEPKRVLMSGGKGGNYLWSTIMFGLGDLGIPCTAIQSAWNQMKVRVPADVEINRTKLPTSSEFEREIIRQGMRWNGMGYGFGNRRLWGEDKPFDEDKPRNTRELLQSGTFDLVLIQVNTCASNPTTFNATMDMFDRLKGEGKIAKIAFLIGDDDDTPQNQRRCPDYLDRILSLGTVFVRETFGY